MGMFPLLTRTKSIDVGNNYPVEFTLDDIRNFLHHNHLAQNLMNDLWTELTGSKYSRDPVLINLDSKYFTEIKYDKENGFQIFPCNNFGPHGDQGQCFPPYMIKPTLNDQYGVTSVNDEKSDDEIKISATDAANLQEIGIKIEEYVKLNIDQKIESLSRARRINSLNNHPDKRGDVDVMGKINN